MRGDGRHQGNDTPASNPPIGKRASHLSGEAHNLVITGERAKQELPSNQCDNREQGTSKNRSNPKLSRERLRPPTHYNQPDATEGPTNPFRKQGREEGDNLEPNVGRDYQRHPQNATQPS